MAQCHTEGKKHPSGAIELYVGVFNSKLHNSSEANGNVDRHQSWSRYNLSNYNSSLIAESYRKDMSSDRMALNCGSFREDKVKAGASVKTDAYYGGNDGSNLKCGGHNNGGTDPTGVKSPNRNGGLFVGAGKIGGLSCGIDTRNGNSNSLAAGSSLISNGGIHKRENSDLGFRADSYPNGEVSKWGMKPSSETSLKIGPYANSFAGPRTPKFGNVNALSPNRATSPERSWNGAGSLQVGGGVCGGHASNGGSPSAEVSRGGWPSTVGNIIGNSNINTGARTPKLADSNASSYNNNTVALKGSSNAACPVVGSLQVGGGSHGEAASNVGSSNGGSPIAGISKGARPSNVGNINGNGVSPTMGTVKGVGNITSGSGPNGTITGNLGILKSTSLKAVVDDSQPSTPATFRGTSSRNTGLLNSDCGGSLRGATTPRNSAELNPNCNGNLKVASSPQQSSERSLNGGIFTSSNPGGAPGKGTKSTVASPSPPRARTGGSGILNVGNICRGNVLSGGNLSSGKPISKGNGKAECANGNILNAGNLSNGLLGVSGSVFGTGNLSNGIMSKGNRKGDALNGATGASGTGNMPLASEGFLMKRALTSTDPEEVKKAGNDQYKKGHFSEALCLYDRAITLSPSYAPYRSNRAAALTGLGRLSEAVQECEEAIKLDLFYARAHQRAAALYLRIGLVESAKRHFQSAGEQADQGDLQRLQNIEKHISRCIEFRKSVDWKAVMRESDAAVVAGADSAPQIFGYKAEALLKLHRPEEADVVLAAAQRVESSLTKPGVREADSFLLVVRAQIDLALGRYEGAISAAESAARIDPRSTEVSVLLRRARAVGHARTVGNELFKAGKFIEACASYGEGLESDPRNAVLLCNRAACRSKLGQWEKAVEDCNAALNVQPNYTKALMRRANCNSRLERWEDALRDYEVLQREVPGDMEVARGLFDVQVAIKKSRGEEIYKMKFGGDVAEVSSNDQFREAVTSPGLAVVQFNTRWNDRCREISPFMDQLCKRYPSVNFVKVDVDDNPYLAKTESVSFVPTFKIYKNGLKVKEILGPSQQALEYAVKHYSL